MVDIEPMGSMTDIKGCLNARVEKGPIKAKEDHFT